MRKADLPRLLLLEKRCFDDPWPKSAFTELLDGSPWYSLLVFHQEEIIAYSAWMIAANELHLASIAVEPKWRRKSVARNLLGRILEHATAKGCGEILLEVRESNEAARKFYERNGFAELYRRPNYYHQPREGAIVMVRSVTPTKTDG